MNDDDRKLFEKLVLKHEPVVMGHEVGEKLKGFSSQWDRITSPAKLSTLHIEHTVCKTIIPIHLLSPHRHFPAP